jgi:[FeFe] hydrogenase H-cluster maturation GTPase HydF
MGLSTTPQSNRLQIIILGRRNSGKSSLLNAMTGQDVALVNDTPGTTTDPVIKAMEIHGIGPCLFIDTAGFDDEGQLGKQRVEMTIKSLDKADMALLLCEPEMDKEMEWIALLGKRNIPFILILNKTDLREDVDAAIAAIQARCGSQPLAVSAVNRTGIDRIRQAIIEHLPEDYDAQSITGNLVGDGDLVLLVMPQDIQAPKGRLILPQVQTLRELLDKKCIVMSCTTDKLDDALKSLAHSPKLIITDSQAFKTVYQMKPDESKLTSFSVLFAAYKGDIDYYARSAEAIAHLTSDSHVLIAEACTHAPLSEDIGRVKIPRLLRKRVGEGLCVDIVSGNDFPEDLTPYDLIIQCGACMFNRKYVLNRIEKAKQQHVPMTNYGIAIAWLNGILDKVSW